MKKNENFFSNLYGVSPVSQALVLETFKLPKFARVHVKLLECRQLEEESRNSREKRLAPNINNGQAISLVWRENGDALFDLLFSKLAIDVGNVQPALPHVVHMSQNLIARKRRLDRTQALGGHGKLLQVLERPQKAWQSIARTTIAQMNRFQLLDWVRNHENTLLQLCIGERWESLIAEIPHCLVQEVVQVSANAWQVPE